jgi:hypothetical protein
MLAQTKRTTSIAFSPRLPRGLPDAPAAPFSAARERARTVGAPTGTRDPALVVPISLVGLLVSLMTLPADMSWMP